MTNSFNKSKGKQRTVVSWNDPLPTSIRRFAPHMALARARAHGYSLILYRHVVLDFGKTNATIVFAVVGNLYTKFATNLDQKLFFSQFEPWIL